jgi:hypothetical protein
VRERGIFKNYRSQAQALHHHAYLVRYLHRERMEMLAAPPRGVGKGRWPGCCGEAGFSQVFVLRSKKVILQNMSELQCCTE